MIAAGRMGITRDSRGASRSGTGTEARGEANGGMLLASPASGCARGPLLNPNPRPNILASVGIA